MRPRYYSYLDEVVPPTQVPPCLDDCEIFVTHLPPKANSEAPGLAVHFDVGGWREAAAAELWRHSAGAWRSLRSSEVALGGGFERSSTSAHWQGQREKEDADSLQAYVAFKSHAEAARALEAIRTASAGASKAGAY